MSELVILCKPYQLIFKVEGIVRDDFAKDSISINEMGPDEVGNLLCPHFS